MFQDVSNVALESNTKVIDDVSLISNNDQLTRMTPEPSEIPDYANGRTLNLGRFNVRSPLCMAVALWFKLMTRRP
ncbi:hypothetical protein TNCV_4557151 [Trichonephila clavipes]|nr:hypothetical protein TNCV_4557151 [Trichonephila clavipes]